MKPKVHMIIAGAISGLFLIADQTFKYIAEYNRDFTYYYIKPWLGWEYLKNPGVAFGIPIPQFIVIPLSIAILLGAVCYLAYEKKKSALSSYALFLIIGGAISNLVDRIVYIATIDYFRIITSVINVGDIMIMAGAVLLIIDLNRKP